MTNFSSLLLSLSFHASLLTGLYLLPSAIREQFRVSGRNQAITLQLMSAVDASPSSVEVLVTVESTKPPHREPQPEELQPRKLDVEDPQSPPLQTFAAITLSPDVAPKLHATELQPKKNEDSPPLPEQSVAPKPISKQPEPAPAVHVTITLPEALGTDDHAADLTSNQPPEYPQLAYRSRLEGVVLVQLKIDDSGQVIHVELIKSSGHRVLDQAAMEAVRKWKGQPATKAGIPVESVELLPIRFRL